MRRPVLAPLLLFVLAAEAPDAEEPAPRSAAVDAVFAELAAERAPGCAVGVARGDTLIHAAGYGYANLEYDLPLDADSVFRTGSLSKQFTAAAVALAAEEGLLDLDAPL
ncbi:MAG: serine hydrolase domain-containing protein, partial [Pseudomonadales bacterium]|nr:serine hydrolase domain-containing protein [Pseudomonadales bacterium]